MATKAQKRRNGLQKRAAFEASERVRGLENLAKDKEHRRREELKAWQEQHDTKHSWTKRIDECPHCRIEKSRAKQAVEEKS